jgi:hypothetical protein
LQSSIRESLNKGCVIPASPLALNASRKLDERRQRALWRYYAAAGAGGIAIGVHTTQFAIREPQVGLYKPLLELGAEEMSRADACRSRLRSAMIRVGGVCGKTDQAVSEATILRDLGYHIALLSLAAMKEADDDALIAHCRAVAEIMPLMGFYLQPAVGGRVLPYSFWRRFADIENVVAIKMAPFNRYYTIDVIRAIAESGRDDIALYTGNDDNIVIDLLTPYVIPTSNAVISTNGRNPLPDERAEKGISHSVRNDVTRRMVGGLLGHWAVWTKKAVELVEECHAMAGADIPAEMLARNIQITDCNAAFFDTANNFAGCIAGIHEVLRRQGLFEGIWCLDPNETLSPGQSQEIDRVYMSYPHLNDDTFVREHLDEWLSG